MEKMRAMVLSQCDAIETKPLKLTQINKHEIQKGEIPNLESSSSEQADFGISNLEALNLFRIVAFEFLQHQRLPLIQWQWGVAPAMRD